LTPLFDPDPPTREPLEEGAVLLRGFASADAAALVDEAAASPRPRLSAIW
jgi:hypothetical protein